MNITIILLATIVYVLSIFWIRHELIIFHEEEMEVTTPGFMDMVVAFVPTFNTIWAACFFLARNGKKKKKQSLADKFFKAK